MNINTSVYQQRWGEAFVQTDLLISGLLAPDGTLYACKDSEHEYLAEAIIEKIGSTSNGLYDPKDELLCNRGWLRVSSHSQPYVSSYRQQAITQSQLDTLFDLYVSIRRERTSVIYVTTAKAQLRRLLNINVQE